MAETPSHLPTMAETPSHPHPHPHPPRRSRPRVREVSSRFMSPSLKQQQPPSTPSQLNHRTLRRTQTDLRLRFADENRPDSLNSRSLSPFRSNKPRSAVKLFKESSRPDTPMASTPLRQRDFNFNFNTPAAKLLRIKPNTKNNNSDCSLNSGDESDDLSSIDGDCDSVNSEPCEIGNTSIAARSRFSTPCSRSMESPFPGHRGGGNEEKRGNLMVKTVRGVARGLNLPPMPVEVKKAARKESSQVEEVHRYRLMYNRYLQWRFANAKAQASLLALKNHCQKQLYCVAVKISELRDSVKSKRIEYGFLKGLTALSTILDAQMPYLDAWSTLDESYSSSLLELSNGLLQVLSQLPLDGNVKADLKEIEVELLSALKATEMICQQVQNFMPKAELVDSLISELARVSSGEIALIDECGDLLPKVNQSQVEECSLRGQVMQLPHLKLEDRQR